MAESHHTDPAVYLLAEKKANEIEAELKRLNFWNTTLLPAEKFENMGAFGSNTMGFEQWIQFILLPKIRAIVIAKEEFPKNSSLSRYAARVLPDSKEYDNLHQLLYDLDAIVTEQPEPQRPPAGKVITMVPDKIQESTPTMPTVLLNLSEVLPEFQGIDLESQLQTFDIFLAMLPPHARQSISELLLKASAGCTDLVSKQRIEKASSDVASGGRAAEPYDHEQALKEYRAQHKKNFPKKSD